MGTPHPRWRVEGMATTITTTTITNREEGMVDMEEGNKLSNMVVVGLMVVVRTVVVLSRELLWEVGMVDTVGEATWDNHSFN